MRSRAAGPTPSHPMDVAHAVTAYDEGLAVDVVQVQREDVVLAAHVHAVVVLVLQQDAVVTGVEQEVEEVCGAGGLQLCGANGHTSARRSAPGPRSPNLCHHPYTPVPCCRSVPVSQPIGTRAPEPDSWGRGERSPQPTPPFGSYF